MGFEPGSSGLKSGILPLDFSHGELYTSKINDRKTRGKFMITKYALPGQPPENLTAENGCFQRSVVASGPPIHLG